MSLAKKKVSLAPDPWTPGKGKDHYAEVVAAAFVGKMHPGDALHMARAILQLNDEMHEMREQARIREAALIERLRVLEDAVKFLGTT
jgi:predicted fused transcriptional regulator/phosphomethylpyrimidine kinase